MDMPDSIPFLLALLYFKLGDKIKKGIVYCLNSSKPQYWIFVVTYRLSKD